MSFRSDKLPALVIIYKNLVFARFFSNVYISFLDTYNYILFMLPVIYTSKTTWILASSVLKEYYHFNCIQKNPMGYPYI